MSVPSKLTKKQKKGLAFRERKGRKSDTLPGEALDIPELDLLEPTEEDRPLSEPDKQSRTEENPGSTNLGKRKRNVADKDGTDPSKVDDATAGLKKKTRLKTTHSNESTITDKDTKTSESKTKTKSEGSAAQRFILFVGNLKYTTSLDAIREHFSKCDPPPNVRLLTPKAAGAGPTKSRGCAFLEFSHRNALQQGIKLHGSTLDGRRINVELTAGGGGKSENRVKKVQARNKQLLEQRKQQIQKKLETGENVDTTALAVPQRHSTTSGMDHVPQQKRTWSVPAGDETSGRGGAKKRGKKTKLSPNWATGANTITVV